MNGVEITPTYKPDYLNNPVKYVMKNTFNNCYYMFDGCSSLTSLDLSLFDTSNVTDMSYMFRYCSLLTSLDLSSFNTSNVINMSSMFGYCRKLVSLDLSSFDISKVTVIGSIFYYCDSLTNLNPFYNWKQGNVDLSYSPITPLAVHQLIERSMNASDGATARTLQLNSTTKTNWQNSEYYNEDLALLQVKNITIA
jgi:surface protein